MKKGKRQTSIMLSGLRTFLLALLYDGLASYSLVLFLCGEAELVELLLRHEIPTTRYFQIHRFCTETESSTSATRVEYLHTQSNTEVALQTHTPINQYGGRCPGHQRRNRPQGGFASLAPGGRVSWAGIGVHVTYHNRLGSTCKATPGELPRYRGCFCRRCCRHINQPVLIPAPPRLSETRKDLPGRGRMRYLPTSPPPTLRR